MTFRRIFTRSFALAACVFLAEACGKSSNPPASGTKLEDVKKETAEPPRKDLQKGEKMPAPSPTVPQKRKWPNT